MHASPRPPRLPAADLAWTAAALVGLVGVAVVAVAAEVGLRACRWAVLATVKAPVRRAVRGLPLYMERRF